MKVRLTRSSVEVLSLDDQQMWPGLVLRDAGRRVEVEASLEQFTTHAA